MQHIPVALRQISGDQSPQQLLDFVRERRRILDFACRYSFVQVHWAVICLKKRRINQVMSMNAVLRETFEPLTLIVERREAGEHLVD